jgi:hypothetical protein
MFYRLLESILPELVTTWRFILLQLCNSCSLPVQLLLGLGSAITLRSKSHRTRDRILLFHLRLSSLFVASYDSQDYGGGMLSRLHTDVIDHSGHVLPHVPTKRVYLL